MAAKHYSEARIVKRSGLKPRPIQAMMAPEARAIAITESNLTGLLRLLAAADSSMLEPLLEQLARMDESDLQRVADRAANAPPPVQFALVQARMRRRYIERHADWLRAVRRPCPDLEAALIALGEAAGARGVIDVSGRLDAWAREVGDRLSGDRAFDTGLTALAEVLAGRHKLRGNDADYGNPKNSYLQCVLDTGLGIPISLCVVALLVARRLELPVSGIGAPGHFLGFYGDAELGLGTYFDGFHGFRRMTFSQVTSLIGRFVEQIHPSMLKPVEEREILARWLNNLIAAWSEGGEQEHARNLLLWAEAL
jgi:regulator of sirC expression with transglutaminase-like and TPR domain